MSTKSTPLLIGIFTYTYTCWNITELQIQNEGIYWSEVVFPLSQCPTCEVEVLSAAHSCWQIFLTAKPWLFPNPYSCIVQITKLMWQTCSVFQGLQRTCHQIEARMHKSSLYFGSRTDDWNYFFPLTNSPFSRDKLLCSAVNETLGYYLSSQKYWWN